MRRGLLDRLERHLSGWAIPGLAALIVALNAGVWVLSMIQPAFPAQLTLRPELLLRGELWRAATFLFIPPPMGPLWTLLWLQLLFVYAQSLEREWGEFRFNLFYGIGALATVLASLALGEGLSNAPLNTTIFLAFAALHPDFEILIFFLFPAKAKWLALLCWLWILWSLLAGSWATRLSLCAALANYALFFGPAQWQSWKLRAQVWRNRRRFKNAFRDRR